ncbi:hypothetical protein Tco_0132399 [Tanacetum coccineum]
MSHRYDSPVIDPPLPSPLGLTTINLQCGLGPLKNQHNMVVFLTKTEGNDDFADIVDFLNASSIRYSLTVNHTIYVSNIKQFWSTAKTKTTNNETQIYAKVAGKSVVVTKSSVMSNLQFNDEGEKGGDPDTLQILHFLSLKSTAWNEFSTNVASAVICLAKGQKFNFSKLIFDEEGKDQQPSEPQPTPSPAQSFHEEQLSDIPSSSQPQKTQKHRKGRKLSNRVLDLEKAMTAQAKEIAILKKRVKKLEKDKRSRLKVKTLQDGFKEIDFDVGFDVVRDEGITPVEGDAEQVKAIAPMVKEDVPPPKKTQKQLDDERAGLEEAMRLQTDQEAENAELIHLDCLLAQECKRRKK